VDGSCDKAGKYGEVTMRRVTERERRRGEKQRSEGKAKGKRVQQTSQNEGRFRVKAIAKEFSPGRSSGE